MEHLNDAKPVRPDNNLGKAIAAMILFWPVGIPALVNATKVNPFYDDGNYAAAESAAKSASKWGMIGIIVGVAQIAGLVIFYLVYIFVVFILIMAEGL